MDPNTMLLIARREDQKTSHVLHLLLSLITFGIWVPVWIIVAVSHRIERRRLDGMISRLAGQ